MDFTAYQGNYRAAGDAKDKACLTFYDVDKLIVDAGIYKAQERLLFIAADTRVPANVQAHADENRVEILRTRWRS